MSECSRCNASILQHGFVLDDAPICRECNDALRPVCPYCGVELSKRPKAATKCKSCGERMVVRTKQMHFPSTVVTQDQSVLIDFQETMAMLGLTEANWLAQQAELQRRLGRSPSNADTAWALLGAAVFRVGSDPNRLSDVYLAQIALLQREKKDATHILRKFHELQASQAAAIAPLPPPPLPSSATQFRTALHEYELRGVSCLALLAGSSCCAAAAEAAKRPIPAKGATLPLPGCDHVGGDSNSVKPGCSCCFTAISSFSEMTEEEAAAHTERFRREDPEQFKLLSTLADKFLPKE